MSPSTISNPSSSSFDFLSHLDCVPLSVGTCSLTDPPAGSGDAAPVGLCATQATASSAGSPTAARFGGATTAGSTPQLAASSTAAFVCLDAAPVGLVPQVTTSVPGAPARPRHCSWYVHPWEY
jgi:hypothetical protein